jgi:hypothetical protein
MDEIDEYGRAPWRMESTITDPAGVRVSVAITVPPGKTWDDKAVGDCTEIAQMTAARAVTDINKCRALAAERVPF